MITRFSKLQAKAKDKGILLEKCSKYYELWVLGVTAHCSNLNEVEQTIDSYREDGNL